MLIIFRFQSRNLAAFRDNQQQPRNGITFDGLMEDRNYTFVCQDCGKQGFDEKRIEIQNGQDYFGLFVNRQGFNRANLQQQDVVLPITGLNIDRTEIGGKHL